MKQARAVFITGGGSGLGEAVARRLSARGWRVALAGRDTKKLKAAASKLGKAQIYGLNVADADAVDSAIRDFQPDGLVCCAATLGQGSVFDALTAERFAEVHAINVAGTFHACASAMRLWRKSGVAGDIVNVASLAGIRGLQKFPGFAAYASSKHAVIGLTEALALEGKAQNIRVNAVAPGAMRTAMMAALGFTPKTNPDDVAPTIEFLLDRTQSGVLTGTTIEVHCNDD